MSRPLMADIFLSVIEEEIAAPEPITTHVNYLTRYWCRPRSKTYYAERINSCQLIKKGDHFRIEGSDILFIALADPELRDGKWGIEADKCQYDICVYC